MDDGNANTDVLISGGGPVGLVLALCLSRQGVRSIAVNDRKVTTTPPKARSRQLPFHGAISANRAERKGT